MSSVEDYLEKIVKRNNPNATPYDEQRLMARTLYDSLSTPGTIQVGQGPTGMGKTAVEVAVAKKLCDDGKRVLIAAPSYEHVETNLKGDAEMIFSETPPVWIGLSNDRYQKIVQTCPLEIQCTGGDIQDCKNVECAIRQERMKCNNSSIVFTVHHVLVSTPSIINSFDAVIIDESHGYPNVIANHGHKTINLGDTLKSGILQSQDTQNLTRYLNANKKPPQAIIDRIFNIIKTKAKNAKDKVINEFNFFYKCEWTSDGKLYFSGNVKPYKHNGKTSVGLISATIEDAHDHVRDCGFGELTVRPTCKIDTDYFRRRFEHRPIYALIDGPNLGKGDPPNYKIFRDAANDIIAKLVNTIDQVTLILCQNNDDANSVGARLKAEPVSSNRVTTLPDELVDDEMITYENYIRNEIQKGKNVIIATASSKLWEGANFPFLKFLIIDSLPYRRQAQEERGATGKKAHYAWRSQKRFMLNRIQQGIGRLVRKEGEWGIAVVIDGRFYHGFKQFTKDMPRFITDYIYYKQTDDVIKALPLMVTRLVNGGDARQYTRLDDFFHKGGEK